MTEKFANAHTGAVVIGRNEGSRLVTCLASLSSTVPRLIYVDSGSTDESVLVAERAGAIVVRLDMSQPFTAARARNAGWQCLLEKHPDTAFVQFVDGDCEVVEGWLQAASCFMAANAEHAVACGRRRERFPEQSVYNHLCDLEWDTPVGDAKACGGDALVRVTALKATGGYRSDLIAGEEPEWCVRLRDAGWKIQRLDCEMTLHDAAMRDFGQWWQRTKRSGFAFAAGASLHGKAPHFHWVSETRRAIFWGAVIPALSILAGLFSAPAVLAAPLLYALQVMRLHARGLDLAHAFFLTLGKLAEARGVAQFAYERLMGRRSKIIEYK